jgi:phosphatidylserine/phosphatidylglycerophosphate/cardiolipin synthase-like enzyme
MLNRKYLYLIGLIIVLAISMSIVFSVYPSPPGNISTPQTISANGTIEVGFSPHGGITNMIVKELNGAKKSIEVQASTFASTEIAKALVDAFKRRVDVRIILDDSQEAEKYSSATFIAHAGIPVHIDREFQLAHSKIMIVDRVDVITGSFNFTKAAEQRNAENCIILRGNQQLANIYEKNWQWRWGETESVYPSTIFSILVSNLLISPPMT